MKPEICFDHQLIKSKSIVVGGELRLNDIFCQNHYLAGLFQQEVRSALNQVSDVRKIALRSLRDLLTKHELDDRYQNKVLTYFPLHINISIESYYIQSNSNIME